MKSKFNIVEAKTHCDGLYDFNKELSDYYSGKSNWIDLRASKDYTLHHGEFAIIKLGVSMKLPKGYEALLAPRSSTFKNFGIVQTNSVGVIDETYCGDNDEWGMPVLCLCKFSPHHTDEVTIHKGDRICQFRIINHMEPLSIKIVDSLSDTNRGGFGTTGVK